MGVEIFFALWALNAAATLAVMLYLHDSGDLRSDDPFEFVWASLAHPWGWCIAACSFVRGAWRER